MSTQPTSLIQQTEPAPQTIQGVITTYANPLIQNPSARPSSLVEILSRNHLMAILMLDTAETVNIYDGPIPFKIGQQTCFYEALLNMGMYITTGLTMTFWLNAPEPVTGKFLMEFSPDDEGNFGTKNQSNKIEWDVGSMKMLSIPMTSTNQARKKVCGGYRTRGNTNGPDFYAPGFRYADNMLNLGKLSISIKSPIQAGSLFPDQFALYIFASFIDPQLSTIRSYRTAAHSASGNTLITYVTD